MSSLWHNIRNLATRIYREDNAYLCLACVYAGIVSTMLLPVSIVATLQPASFLLLTPSPLAAIPLAILVFDNRAYRRWRANSKSPLGVKLIRACSDGITWFRWLKASNKASIDMGS